jgi:type IV secretion system protein VirB5
MSHSDFKALRIVLVAGSIWVGVTPLCHAQMAVIDVTSIAKLVQQVGILTQQLTQAKAQLLQAQTTYQSMTGARGMQMLMSAANPNYLPTNSSDLWLTSIGEGPSPTLADAVTTAVTTDAVLTPAQLAVLPEDQQALIQLQRQNAALGQALGQLSLANASDRFADVQRLNSAIATTADEKGVLELQATIGAEQGMLLGEQTKLQVLDRAVQAQQMSIDQRVREMIVLGEGRFATRFEPLLQ